MIAGCGRVGDVVHVLRLGWSATQLLRARVRESRAAARLRGGPGRHLQDLAPTSRPSRRAAAARVVNSAYKSSTVTPYKRYEPPHLGHRFKKSRAWDALESQSKSVLGTMPYFA